MVVQEEGKLPDLMIPYDDEVPAYAIYGLGEENANQDGEMYVAEFA